MAQRLGQQNGIRGLAPIVCLLLVTCIAGPAICESESQPTAEPTRVTDSRADFSVSLKAGSPNAPAVQRARPESTVTD